MIRRRTPMIAAARTAVLAGVRLPALRLLGLLLTLRLPALPA
ncbi:MAG: hypothetical protein V2J24_22925 [Pseudomonadales bacterium]|nr:hypothetical protein [Pseudomonadales bacterium]